MDERKLMEFLHYYRIRPTFAGRAPLEQTLKILCAHPERMDEPLVRIFREIAPSYEASDKQICNNIDTICKRIAKIDLRYLTKIAGYPVETKPKVKQLVEILLNYLLRDM